MIVASPMSPMIHHRSPLIFMLLFLIGPILFNKIFAHGTEDIYQHSCFKTYSSMHNIWRNIKCIADGENFLFTTDLYFKNSAFDIRDLRMIMLVQGPHSAFFKLH